MDDPDSQRNRDFWNRSSLEYQQRHGEALEQDPRAWGPWRVPESRLQALGPLQGLRVLELGCGAAQWSIALAPEVDRIVALDLSEQQLQQARAAVQGCLGHSRLHLVQANALQLPFADSSFDLVLSDHGATTFSEPRSTFREISRVLRPGGRVVFCHTSPFFEICFDPAQDRVGRELRVSYFDLGRIEDDESVSYQLSYSAWISVFRENGLWLEDLIELRPEPGAQSSYAGYADLEWARNWPSDCVWKLVKAREPGRVPSRA